jgi:hypothetical protein
MRRDSDPNDLSPSGNLGRIAIPGYHVLQCIGRGGTGTVFRAVQLSLQREVALKVLSPRLARMPGFTDRFVREARSAGAVHHPNVVTCYDVGESDGLVYQALELMAGGNLQHFIAQRGGRLPQKEAIAIIIDCAHGLEGIHRAGLVHGDIKPANVFITDDEVVKLADLGLARSMLGDRRHASGRLVEGLAMTPPELLTGESLPDIRCDIYSLAATLFTMVTGTEPFAASTFDALKQQIIQAPVPDPRDYDPTISAGIAAVIFKAMAKDPAARYASPVLLREDLERLQFDFAPVHAHLPHDDLPAPGGAAFQPGHRTVVGFQAGEDDPSLAAAASPPARTIPPAPVPAASAAPGWLDTRALVFIGSIAGILLGSAVILLVWTSHGRGEPPLSPIVPPSTAAAAIPAPSAGAAAATVVPTAVSAEPRPPWAAASGRDARGRWADAAIAGVTQRFRFCPPGTFTMGDAPPADGIGLRVTLSRGFWLADSEVTQQLYQAVMHANPSSFRGDSLPVECVSWEDCEIFLARVNAQLAGGGARLPSEAEWEYACRAGGAPVLAGSDGWFAENSNARTHPVAGLTPNAWGLYDMLGNVMEWCQDDDGPLAVGSVVDPIGRDGVGRVVRGGAWSAGAGESTSGMRTHYLPVARFAFLGFRFAIGN